MGFGDVGKTRRQLTNVIAAKLVPIKFKLR